MKCRIASMENFKELVVNNLIAFMAVFLASIAMINLSGYDVEVGTYLYLPIGAKILVFLLFGRQVLIGVIASCIFCGVVLFDSWGGNIIYGAIGAITGAIIPLISIWILEKFKLADYSNLKNINFRHILFLIFFTAILHSLTRFFIYAKSAVFSINPIDFLSHYIVGDMIGGIVVIWTVLKVLPFIVSAARA